MIYKLIGLAGAILINSFACGQRIGFDIIDDSRVSSWLPKTKAEYQNVYSFGDSEMESSLLLLYSDGKYYAQIWRYKIDESTKREWFRDFVNLKNVRIEENRFYSDFTNGEFVIYDYGKRKVKGLKVYTSWSGWEKGIYEIGITGAYNLTKYFEGKFAQASFRKLTQAELKKMTKFDLKVMRNEIYARYGYKFKPNSQMDSYFKQQDWYTGWYNNVNNYLTAIEIENIKLIKKYEKE